MNGENTLDKQRLPDVKCRMWILTDPARRSPSRGYQLGIDRVETFRVLSAPESKAREVNYGADVGTITMTVFPEGKEPAPDLSEDAAEKSAVATAELPAEPSKSFDALKAKLLGGRQPRADRRGGAGGGEGAGGEVHPGRDPGDDADGDLLQGEVTEVDHASVVCTSRFLGLFAGRGTRPGRPGRARPEGPGTRRQGPDGRGRQAVRPGGRSGRGDAGRTARRRRRPRPVRRPCCSAPAGTPTACRWPSDW